jgi:hypothetical protein
MLRILINQGGVELHNRVNVSVYPVWNVSVSIRYKTLLLETWAYEYFESIKVMQRYSPQYLEHCLITVTLDRVTFDLVAEFDHKSWNCMQPVMHDPAVSQALTEFNRVNRLELLRNMTIINVLSR